ncbi:MAG: 50S ribosomal protein L20 [Candidatus Omnitrophota bacterium]|nr:50S ribosomal protein L20 [Candidatus Omnitrophota bacterium]
MPRSTNAPASRRRRKKVLKRAKGFFSGRRKLFRTARETVIRAMVYATRDRKVRKREFRRLWQARIGARSREFGLSYSVFISGLIKAKVELDRKSLAELAVRDADAFQQLVELAKSQRSVAKV